MRSPVARAFVTSSLLSSAALSIFTWSTRALADNESAAAVVNAHDDEPKKVTTDPNEVVVQGAARSPSFTQSRQFSTTRFWLLDPGKQSIEAWYSSRIDKDGEKNTTKHLWQLEYAYSPFRGLQVDLYFNYQWDKAQKYHVEGAQLEARIAPFRYGEVFLNPVLYVEWHPRNRDVNRGELRLLLGGEIVRGLRGAINPFFEQNLDSAGPGSTFLADREIGVTGALSYAVIDQVLSLGGETRLVLDQQGMERGYNRVAKVGPSFWLRIVEERVFVTGSFLFGLTKHSDKLNPIVIFGVHF
ncbi:MAG: hypothetical protein ABI175_28515 [Polyangiales bacterium]